jgi:hypothetical protein
VGWATASVYQCNISTPRKRVRATPPPWFSPRAFCRAELIPRADRWAQPYLILDTGERDAKGGVLAPAPTRRAAAMTSRTDLTLEQRRKGRGTPLAVVSFPRMLAVAGRGLSQVVWKSDVVRAAPLRAEIAWHPPRCSPVGWERVVPRTLRGDLVGREGASDRAARPPAGDARTAVAGDLPAWGQSSTQVLIRGGQVVACSNGRMRGHYGRTGPQRHRSCSQVVDFFTPHQIKNISSKIDICTIQTSPHQCKSISFAAIRS